MKKNRKFIVVLSYGGNNTDVKVKMFAESLADVLMCARGWLMYSRGSKSVHVYDVNGFCLGAYAL